MISLWLLFVLIVLVVFIEFIENSISPLSSCILAVAFSFFGVSFLYSFTLFIGLDILIMAWFFLALVGFLLYNQIRYATNFYRLKDFGVDWSALLFLLLLVLCILGLQPHISKWGRWDAVAIWNLHAKFLYDSANWKNYLIPELEWSHPDYPLFLPAVVAYFWRAAGSVNSSVPFIISLFFTLAVPVLLYDGLPKKSFLQKLTAIIVPLLLVSNDTYLKWGLSQMADVPLSFMMLASLFLLSDSFTKHNFRLFLFSIVFLLAAVWVKNEAMLFLFSFGLCWWFLKPEREISSKNFIYLILLVLALMLPWFYFKFILAPQNDLLVRVSIGGILKHLTNAGRYKIIATHLLNILSSAKLLWLIIPFVGALIMRRKKLFKEVRLISFMVLCVMYFFVYVLTPKEIIWHLETSQERLLIHLVPLSLFITISSIYRRA